jgi:hypothetical protein
MYTREKASRIRQTFWTKFGQYMAPHHSDEGLKVNWVNYKTGIKHLVFRMEADKAGAYIRIELNHPDEGIQALFFEQLEELKGLLHATLGEEWDWVLHGQDAYGRPVSYVESRLEGVSVFQEDDWPALIRFFKPRILALDVFWTDARYSFDALK